MLGWRTPNGTVTLPFGQTVSPASWIPAHVRTTADKSPGTGMTAFMVNNMTGVQMEVPDSVRGRVQPPVPRDRNAAGGRLAGRSAGGGLRSAGSCGRFRSCRGEPAARSAPAEDAPRTRANRLNLRAAKLAIPPCRRPTSPLPLFASDQPVSRSSRAGRRGPCKGHRPARRAGLHPSGVAGEMRHRIRRRCLHGVWRQFVLATEVSCIWRQDDKSRRVHLLIWAPDFEAVEYINGRLAKVQNLASDGRPM